jgi:NADPH:quinone reductase-like Zn-dependent oxidoreductase
MTGTMDAVTCEPSSTIPLRRNGLRLGDAPDPAPEPGQVLVRVQATSLNFGEVAFLADHVGPGDVAGWDAAGSVGRFAAQLASRAGAHVVALAGSPERAEGLRELGVSEVVFGLDELAAPVDAVLENVGGDVLSQALDHLSPEVTSA